MPSFEWNTEKNELLKNDRGVSFENVVSACEEGKVLDMYPHPNQQKYPGQRMLVVEINNYVHLVPCIREDETIFLKTIIPSRTATEKYINSRKKK